MTATSKPLRSVDHRADLNEPPADSSPCIIDFFAGRDRLLAEIDQAAKHFEIKQPVRTALPGGNVRMSYSTLLKIGSIR